MQFDKNKVREIIEDITDDVIKIGDYLDEVRASELIARCDNVKAKLEVIVDMIERSD